MPVGSSDYTDRGITLRGERQRVCGRILGVKGDLLLQTRLGILLGERDASGADMEGEYRIGLLGTNARDLSRKVELGERRIEGPDCLAFEVSHRRLDVLVASLIIGAKEHHPLEVLVGHVLADRCR